LDAEPRVDSSGGPGARRKEVELRAVVPAAAALTSSKPVTRPVRGSRTTRS
jgi:hypothetical protein